MCCLVSILKSWNFIITRVTPWVCDEYIREYLFSFDLWLASAILAGVPRNVLKAIKAGFPYAGVLLYVLNHIYECFQITVGTVELHWLLVNIKGLVFIDLFKR